MDVLPSSLRHWCVWRVTSSSWVPLSNPSWPRTMDSKCLWWRGSSRDWRKNIHVFLSLRTPTEVIHPSWSLDFQYALFNAVPSGESIVWAIWESVLLLLFIAFSANPRKLYNPIYDGQLQCCSPKSSHDIAPLMRHLMGGASGHPLIFHHCDGKESQNEDSDSKSWQNIKEGEVVMNYLTKLLELLSWWNSFWNSFCPSNKECRFNLMQSIHFWTLLVHVKKRRPCFGAKDHNHRSQIAWLQEQKQGSWWEGIIYAQQRALHWVCLLVPRRWDTLVHWVSWIIGHINGYNMWKHVKTMLHT